MIPVEGRAWFRSDCQDGGVGDPYARPLELWKCDLPVETVALAEDLPEVTIMGDCHKNTITIRREGKSETWELARNLDYSSSFDLDISNFPSAVLRDDGQGATHCTARLSLSLYGKMRCQPGPESRYKADIEVEAIWWVNKSVPVPSPSPTASPTPQPSPSATASPGPAVTPASVSLSRAQLSHAPLVNFEASSLTTACNLPPQCYFYTSTNIRQCR
jgi:hypothetical protein